LASPPLKLSCGFPRLCETSRRRRTAMAGDPPHSADSC